MMDRFRTLPNYRYYDSADGVITTEYEKPLRDYKIFGSSGGLGDLCPNLCNPDEIVTDGRKENGYVYGQNIDIWVKAGTYTLTFKYGGNIGTAFFFRKGQVSSGYFGRIEPPADAFFIFTFTEDMYLRISHFGSKTEGYLYDFMLVKGSYKEDTMPEYEPYYPRYYIPIEHKDADGKIQVYKIRLAKPLEEGELVDYKSGLYNLPEIKLNKGKNFLTVKTETLPDAVSYQYYA